jgi:hypothetical protein
VVFSLLAHPVPFLSESWGSSSIGHCLRGWEKVWGESLGRKSGEVWWAIVSLVPSLSIEQLVTPRCTLTTVSFLDLFIRSLYTVHPPPSLLPLSTQPTQATLSRQPLAPPPLFQPMRSTTSTYIHFCQICRKVSQLLGRPSALKAERVRSKRIWVCRVRRQRLNDVPVLYQT